MQNADVIENMSHSRVEPASLWAALLSHSDSAKRAAESVSSTGPTSSASMLGDTNCLTNRNGAKRFKLVHKQSLAVANPIPWPKDPNKFAATSVVRFHETLLHQRYALVAQIGEGRYGTIYKAQEDGSNNTVAVKVSRSDNPVEDPVDAREFFFLQQAACGNIVSLIDAWISPAMVVIAMEKMTEDFWKMLKKIPARTVSATVAGSIAKQIAKGLEALHAQNIIHRDLYVKKRVSQLHRVRSTSFLRSGSCS